ncbi:phosphatidate cytidylyltransferase [Chryseobacterium sp. A321]
MKNLKLFTLFALLFISLSSCAAVETVFKAGMWWGILVVIGVIALLFWLFTRGGNK